ncbi:Granulin [Amphibalanus amphitrite]|uniref:Granulin n=1 Tax=Amphibalanus amphitrite TaxID=1232801 RepID=A0A6A4VRC4_AMPAM|nr:Granulin [Amphibalanus amphitrite]
MARLGTALVPLLVLLVPLAPALADRCPGGELACPEPSVCCRTDSPQQPFICCPYRNGVCCGDGRHCCREGFTCDLSTSRCVKQPPEPGLCPDGKSRCPPEATCCPLADHRWGCCPYARAVCCSDKVHCCPEGTQCDLQTLTCLKKSEHPMMQFADTDMKGTEGHIGLHA